MILTIFVLAVFLTGCATTEIGVAGEDDDTEPVRKDSSSSKSSTGTKTDSRYTSPSDDDEEDEPEEHITMTESNTGDDVTFKKLGPGFRDKEVNERCDLDYPFECARYTAKDGVIYLAVKNKDYGSIAEEVTLYLDGDACDPMETEIEPGQNIDFECYPDTDTAGDLISGKFEIDYYRPIGENHFTKTGSLTVIME